MKYSSFILAIALCGAMGSCIKDEPLNAECDINSAWIHYDNPSECTWNLNDTIIPVVSTSDNTITFEVRANTDRTRLAPQFDITPGATITPASGTERDFSQGPQTYRVVSEDGNWEREYKVAIEIRTRTVSDTIKYDFERYTLHQEEGSTEKYYVWSDLKEDGSEANNWASGNPGFKIQAFGSAPDDYPTTPEANGHSGHAIKLTTRKTGPLATAYGIHLASGNMYLGTFNPDSALTNTLMTTNFGLPFDRKPIKLTGYYKYKHGENFQNHEGQIIPGTTDRGDIYALLYENHDENGKPVMLHGKDVLSSPYIVAKARVPHIGDTDEWTKFEEEFQPTNGKTIDSDKLENFGYNLTVVFSSSIDGAYFEGAVGSTMYVDEVRLICEKEE